jgi:hypothetical protein
VTLEAPLKLTSAGSGRVLLAGLGAPSGPLAAGVTPHLHEVDPVRQLELAADKAAELLHPMPMPMSMPRPMPVMLP